MYWIVVDAQHGSGEAEIINRLPLSLTPSRPRLARVGDDFEAGTIITVSGDQKEGVPVTVTLLADPNKSESIKQLPSNDGHEPRIQGSQGCEAGVLTTVWLTSCILFKHPSTLLRICCPIPCFR